MTQPALPVPPVPPPLPGEPVAAPPGGPPPQPPPRVLRPLIVAVVCLVLGIVAAGIAGGAFALLRHNPSLRTVSLLMLVIAGALATLLFGATMVRLDSVLDWTPPPPWYARASIDLAKRLLLVLQLLTTAATLVALGALVFHPDIPRF